MTGALGALLLGTLATGCVVHGGGHRGDPYGRFDHGRRDGRRHEGYACRPCGHQFGGWGELRAHLHGMHRLPYWRIPRVVVRVGLDWVYFG